MAIKVLRDKIITVRATDITVDILKKLAKEMGLSQADIIEEALKHYSSLQKK